MFSILNSELTGVYLFVYMFSYKSILYPRPWSPPADSMEEEVHWASPLFSSDLDMFVSPVTEDWSHESANLNRALIPPSAFSNSFHLTVVVMGITDLLTKELILLL